MFLARIYISPKPTVNDPEGITILSSLGQLGYQNVSSVRSGKYIEIQIDEVNEPTARKKVMEMCDKLLANPVIEEYRLELKKVN
jgi:phosphoribosylformylglycinamidine synthase